MTIFIPPAQQIITAAGGSGAIAYTISPCSFLFKVSAHPAAVIEAGTYYSSDLLRYGNGENQEAYAVLFVPAGFAGGTLNFRLHFKSAITSGNIEWGLAWRFNAAGDATDLDGPLSVESTTIVSAPTAGKLKVASIDLTGIPAGPGVLTVRLRRLAAGANDTLVGEVDLVKVGAEEI